MLVQSSIGWQAWKKQISDKPYLISPCFIMFTAVLENKALVLTVCLKNVAWKAFSGSLPKSYENKQLQLLLFFTAVLNRNS